MKLSDSENEEWDSPEYSCETLRIVSNQIDQDINDSRFEVALQKLVWIFDGVGRKGLKICPTDTMPQIPRWKLLLEKHPASKIALRNCRDEAADRVIANLSPKHSFGIYVDCNKLLEEEDKTIEFFLELDVAYPNQARKVYQRIHRELVIAKQLQICGKYIDIRKMVPWIVKQHRRRMGFFNETRNSGIQKILGQERYQDFIRRQQLYFLIDIGTLIALLVINFAHAEAQEAADAAYDELNTPESREMIHKALLGRIPETPEWMKA